jgi:Raf kinase inhibitor-like YbhB/YbcL family protein
VIVSTLAAAFALTSPAFHGGTIIPKTYACDGQNVSPPLHWTAPPRRTRSFALLVQDPDAPRGTFTHWVAWNLPARSRSLPRGATPPVQGVNSTGRLGYTGPCPPPGVIHHYVFRLYALNAKLGLRPGADAAGLKQALRGHVLGTARLVGLYVRR